MKGTRGEAALNHGEAEAEAQGGVQEAVAGFHTAPVLVRMDIRPISEVVSAQRRAVIARRRAVSHTVCACTCLCDRRCSSCSSCCCFGPVPWHSRR